MLDKKQTAARLGVTVHTLDNAQTLNLTRTQIDVIVAALEATEDEYYRCATTLTAKAKEAAELADIIKNETKKR